MGKGLITLELAALDGTARV